MKEIILRENISSQKTACVLRFGAWGDGVMASPIFRHLKKDGYYAIAHVNERCHSILKENPNIDKFEVVDEKTATLSYDEQMEYQKKMEPKYDRLINLTGSIENSLVIPPGLLDPITGNDWYLEEKQKRHERCNINYYDHTMKWAGYPEAKGETGELFFTEKEEAWARNFWSKRPGYKVLWAVTGSSLNKAYPYANYCVNAVLDGIENAQVVLVGEPLCKGLIQYNQHKRLTDKCGSFGIRKSFLLAKYADLVVTPETSVNCAAGAFGVPQVVLLSQSTEENLTKYMKSCIAVFQETKCYPCHKLHFSVDSCPLMEIMEGLKVPVCMGALHPKKVLEAIEKQYLTWRQNEQA